MADVNRTLTILEVKDNLSQVIKMNKKLMDQLEESTRHLDNALDNVDDNLKKTSRFNFKATALGSFLGTYGPELARGFARAMLTPIENAKQFNTEFRELENLNLDKSPQQIEKLNDSVLEAAYNAGRLPAEMSKAFFDIQSGTAMFGDDVEKIASKASDFSRAFNVDFNTTIEGAVKGIKNFGLEAEDMDKFFASMQKTIQVGIVTFDQLAKVQTDYAGSANAAGQSVDSANKLFAVFTARAKSAEEAATLTKSAFTDLLRPQTLKAFDKIGVEVFDKQTGKVKQLDEIVQQLDKRFASVRGNDKATAALLNQFHGSEGLTALIGEAAKNGENMLDTFKQFDKVEFNLEKALRNSKLDLDVMQDIVGNKLNVMFTKLGRAIMPDIVGSLQKIDKEILPQIEAQLPVIIDDFKKMFGAIGDGFNWFVKHWREADKVVSRNPFQQKANEKLIQNSPLAARLDIEKLTPTDKFLLGGSADNLLDKDMQVNRKYFPIFEQRVKNYGGLESDEAKKFFDQLKFFYEGRKKIDEYNASLQSPTSQLNEKTNSPTRDASVDKILADAEDRTRRGLSGVSTGGNQVRNVTVNIQKMVGIENLVTTVVEQARGALEEAMRETLIKSIRDAEVGVSNAM